MTLNLSAKYKNEQVETKTVLFFAKAPRSELKHSKDQSGCDQWACDCTVNILFAHVLVDYVKRFNETSVSVETCT